MRATIELDDDTAQAVRRLGNEEDLSVSEAVNALIRQGLMHRGQVPEFVQQTAALGLQIEISGVGEALDALDGDDRR